MSDIAYSPNAFWFSKIRDARTCMHMYKLKHIDGVKIESRSLDMEFGTALNLGLDAIVKQQGDGLSVFEMYWNSTPRTLPRSRFDWEALAKMGPEFLRKFRERHAKHYEPILVGERLFGKLGKHAFEGEPDFYGYYKGKRTVIDFKTSKDNYAPEKIICDEQLPGYAALIEQQYGLLPEQKMYQVFVKGYSGAKIQEPLISQLTSIRQCEILSNIEATCDDLSKRKVFPKNTENCVRGSIICPYFEKCHGKGVVE
jgi:hypothetical protein